MDTTTEAFEPGGGVGDVTPTLGSNAQDNIWPRDTADPDDGHQMKGD